jgi:DNA-binding response OmpR family regulator
VLIVEGQSQDTHGLAEALQSQGMDVEIAEEYLEAVRKMKAGHFGVAIIDVDLPPASGSELTGWDLARVFRVVSPGSALILVTARWNAELGAEAERLRDCCLVEKPINPPDLRAMVRALQAGLE